MARDFEEKKPAEKVEETVPSTSAHVCHCNKDHRDTFCTHP